MKKLLGIVLALTFLTACNPTEEALNCGDVNVARQQVNASPLTRLESLDNKALGHAKAMAEAGRIFHSVNLDQGLPVGWRSAAENVASASTIEEAQIALEASPSHYENMTNPKFTTIGIGSWENPDGTVFLVQIFVEV